ARSTSSRSPSATSQITCSLAGSIVLKVLPEAASTHRPSIKSFLGFAMKALIAGLRSTNSAILAAWLMAEILLDFESGHGSISTSEAEDERKRVESSGPEIHGVQTSSSLSQSEITLRFSYAHGPLPSLRCSTSSPRLLCILHVVTTTGQLLMVL